MDLERIKQQFRIRSGRSKQLKKKNRQGLVTAPTSQQEARTGITNDTPTPPQPSKTVSKEEATVKDEEVERVEDAERDPQPGSSQDTNNQEENEQELAQTNGTSEQTSNPSSTTPAGGEGDTTGDQAVADDHALTREMNEGHLSPSSEADDFDLKPPQPRAKPPSLETLAELLFSADHLNALVHNPSQLLKFSAFLQRYLPNVYPLLSQYLETQKAIKAVEYANAVAEGLKPKPTGEDTSTDPRTFAASLDEEFEKISNASFDALVGNALPRYVSYTLVRIVSECLTNEITGRTTPIMRDLVGGLSEVFCLTDPNQEDNPIIYASEEFYRLTRYGPDETLNSNCRFLQGRKTNRQSVQRLKDAIKAGEEISEALLNYRRDGRPFINLLMIAPLHDRNGKLKYQIGAQVDVTGLVEGGRALEGFQRFLNRRADDKKRDESKARRQTFNDDQQRKSRALSKLRDLSEMFDLEESAIVQAHSRSNSLEREDDDNRSIGSADRSRRVYVDPDASDEFDDEEEGEREQIAKSGQSWALGDAGDGRLSGKLPGVYDSFMLLRPAPSLRIVFVSPKLRRYADVLQTPFLSHVAAPAATLAGLGESLQAGVPVTAKIHFATERGAERNGTRLNNGVKHEDGKHGRAIWISATPLMGADDQVGVWMCVVCEKSKIGSLRSSRSRSVAQQAASPSDAREVPAQTSNLNDQSLDALNRKNDGADNVHDDRPIKPVRIDSNTVLSSPVPEQQQPQEVKEQKKDLRPMESMYFETNEGQSLPREEVGKPERTEDDDRQHDRNDFGEESKIDRTTTPVQRYPEEAKESSKPSKKYGVEIPGLTQITTDDNDSVDEYITTRSPQVQPRQDNERVVIEEDSDVLARDQSEESQDFSEPESPQTATQAEYEREQKGLHEHTGSGFSSDHDRQISEEPDAGLASNAHESAPEGDDQVAPRMDKWAHTTTKSHDSDDTFVDRDSTQEKCEQDADTSPANDHKNCYSDEEPASNSSTNTPKQFRMPSDSNFPVAARASTPPPDQEQSTAIAENESESEDAKTASPTGNQAEAVHHKHDVENWIDDARPASSSSNSQSMLGRAGSGAQRVGMDYLRAGSGRWTNAPALGHQRISEANGSPDDHRMLMRNMDDDLCARSPYSVD